MAFWLVFLPRNGSLLDDKESIMNVPVERVFQQPARACSRQSRLSQPWLAPGLRQSTLQLKPTLYAWRDSAMKKKAIVPDDYRVKYDRWHFSPAVESGGFLFVSGCTGAGPDGAVSGDIIEQFRQAFRNVEVALVEAGLSFADVVEIVSYHVELEKHFTEFVLVKDEFVGEPYPAWTAVGVSALAADGALVEVKVTAKV